MSEQIPRSTGDPDPASPLAEGTGRYSALIGSGAGTLTALLGLAVLGGYLTNSGTLVQIRSDFTPMQANTAAPGSAPRRGAACGCVAEMGTRWG